MRAEKMTCHYFNEATGEFLFAVERVPSNEDFCDSCGRCLIEDDACSQGTTHYWVEYVESKYLGR